MSMASTSTSTRTDNNMELTLGCQSAEAAERQRTKTSIWDRFDKLATNQRENSEQQRAARAGQHQLAVTWAAICHRERYWEITMPLHLVECKPCTISWTGSRDSRIFNDTQHLSAERTTLFEGWWCHQKEAHAHWNQTRQIRQFS